MARVLAVTLLKALADEQRARNTLFPEATDSPIIFGSAAAACHQLSYLLSFEGAPWSEMTVLHSFVRQLGLSIACSIGPASHGDFSFLAGLPSFPAAEHENAIHQVEIELRAMCPAMVRWRMALSSALASQFDAILEGLFITLFELSYFGSFAFLEMLASALRQFHIKWEEAEHELTPAP